MRPRQFDSTLAHETGFELLHELTSSEISKKICGLASVSFASLLVGLGCLRGPQVQVCKMSDQQDPVTGVFHFNMTGQAGVFDVAAGACLTVPNVRTPAITITEQAVPDVTVSAITVQNAVSSGPPDLDGGSITLTMSESAPRVTFPVSPMALPVGRVMAALTLQRFALPMASGYTAASTHFPIASISNGMPAANRFHLDALTSVSCFTVAAQCSSGAAAPTITGSGTGSYNGAAGATIKFTFTDAGEPGINDFASYNIEANGSVVLSASGCLQYGNHQYHPTR